MNVTCTGCPAKYAVPDEKVRGKKVRITCKHCGTNIVVDGTGLDAEASASAKPLAPAVTAPAPASAVREATTAAAVEQSFIVGFIDDRQETHTLSNIVDMYANGQLDDDALVWKDGMPDWLPPFEVPELAIAFKQRGITSRAAKSAFSLTTDEEPTVIGRSPFDDQRARPSVSAPAAIEASDDAPAGTRERAAEAGMGAAITAATVPGPVAASAKAASKPAALAEGQAAAASLRAQRRPGGVDLFGSIADVENEADAGLDFGAAEEPAHKLTGARNESSVLFSLDALTKPDPRANQKQKARDKEQEQKANEALFGEAAPNSLINLGGGGLSALAAPDFTKPVSASFEAPRPSDPVEMAYGTPTQKKKSGGMVLLFGSLFAIAAVAGGAFFMMKQQSSTKPLPSAAVTEPPAPGTAATQAEAPSAGVAVAPVASTSAAPPASASAHAAAAPPPAVAGAGAPTVVSPKAQTAPSAPPAAADANKPAEPAPALTGGAPGTAAPAPAPEGAAFDKNAAIAALGAAAANAASCKQPNGPTGSGKVSVTFAPSGRATATNVAGALAGTEVGGCVARLFRGAKVPPFSGEPITVSKSFTIE